MQSLLARADVALDLGTSKIAVFVKGEGLVLESPACIAFTERRSGRRDILATGWDAAAMRGRTPPGATVVEPIRDGVISDCQAGAWLVDAFLREAGVQRHVARRRFLVGTLFGATGMERRAFEQVALGAGARSVDLVPEPYAAALGAGLPLAEPRASMVVDVGGGATETLVISLARFVGGGSVRIGGDAMNAAIAQTMRRKAGIEIGIHEARRLKEAVAAPIDGNEPLAVRGIDVQRRLPCQATVSAADVRSALTAPIAAITAMVRRVIEALPVELAADLVEHGITLTGGGAATHALQKSLEDAARVAVHAVAAPERAVIFGCGRMLA